MIRNILFDFGNVFIDLHIHATQEALLKIEGLDNQKLEHLFNIDRFHDKYERGELFEDSFFNAVQRCYKPVPDIYEVFKAWNAMLIGIPAARLPKIEALRKNFKTYLFSNTNTTHLRWVHQHLKTIHSVTNFEEHYFDKVYYSHLIGHRKPEPSGFEYILNDAGILAEETLFIDDIKVNTDEASKLGFAVYHHNPDHDIFEVLPDVLNSFS